MKRILHVLVAAEIILIASCGTNASNESQSLEGKKAQLDKLKQEQSKLNDNIQALQKEIDKLDTNAIKKEKAKLVAVETLAPGSFTHYIDLQGKIDALNVAYVAPRNGTGGIVTAIYVKQGDYVKKGQLLLKLDDAVLQKQMAQAQTQLAYAQDLYNRRDNLWKQNIGTEVDVINAKNTVDQVQKQISILKQQIDLTNVYSDIPGVADAVNVRLGEGFTGAVPGTSTPQIRIVNTDNLKATAQVPEFYLDKVKVGSTVKVTLPEINNKTLDLKITVAGKLIDPNTRSFYIEAKMPYDKNFHPNQIALVKIQDYSAPNVLVVPINTVQNDTKGKYVLVAANEKGQLVARKKPVETGQFYADKIIIKNGLQPGDAIITEGIQGLYDGQAITTGR
ncbi:MAG: efflux RND transporter periplasmic adaptor subunit [Bacteroidetes bacterium]|nr:efflux RND transporter periplasmic adaptor subunit [Bacteroidota bacterium]MBS1973672.1 efflux RND transporter periplasmic adaptor subunit [Bacteroidota bacterium]